MALSNATLVDRRESDSVPLLRLEALRLVRLEPEIVGRMPPAVVWINWLIPLKVLP